MKLNKNCIGADFDDFLREEGIFEEVEAGAVKKVLACMSKQPIAENLLTNAEMTPGELPPVVGKEVR